MASTDTYFPIGLFTGDTSASDIAHDLMANAPGMSPEASIAEANRILSAPRRDPSLIAYAYLEEIYLGLTVDPTTVSDKAVLADTAFSETRLIKFGKDRYTIPEEYVSAAHQSLFTGIRGIMDMFLIGTESPAVVEVGAGNGTVSANSIIPAIESCGGTAIITEYADNLAALSEVTATPATQKFTGTDMRELPASNGSIDLLVSVGSLDVVTEGILESAAIESLRVLKPEAKVLFVLDITPGQGFSILPTAELKSAYNRGLRELGWIMSGGYTDPDQSTAGQVAKLYKSIRIKADNSGLEKQWRISQDNADLRVKRAIFALTRFVVEGSNLVSSRFVVGKVPEIFVLTTEGIGRTLLSRETGANGEQSLLGDSVSFSYTNIADMFISLYETNPNARALIHRVARGMQDAGYQLQTADVVGALIHFGDMALNTQVLTEGPSSLADLLSTAPSAYRQVLLMASELLHDLNEAYIMHVFGKHGFEFSQRGAVVTFEDVADPNASVDLINLTGPKAAVKPEGKQPRFGNRIRYIALRKRD